MKKIIIVFLIIISLFFIGCGEPPPPSGKILLNCRTGEIGDAIAALQRDSTDALAILNTSCEIYYAYNGKSYYESSIMGDSTDNVFTDLSEGTVTVYIDDKSFTENLKLDSTAIDSATFSFGGN